MAPPTASLIEISRVLEETARILREHAEANAPSIAARAGDRPAITAPLVRSLVIARQLRGEYFDIGAGGAAWTMLLELLAARLEGRRVNQRRLARAAGIPETTALRLVRALAGAGHLTAPRDPDCRRDLLIALSDEAAARMEEYLEIALGAAALV
ncbi:MAG TPA: hypothetical protein VF693_09205 [Allosphingosinicella sp.]